ncbi:hypothetical protein SSAG_06718 [Streptomyces sp. Mg1]|nr:hypothetical protein SSAG_06718 [Streptomyces sp. Mg1]
MTSADVGMASRVPGATPLAPSVTTGRVGFPDPAHQWFDLRGARDHG